MSDAALVGHSDFVKHDDTGRILFGGSIPTSMLDRQGANVVEGQGDFHTHYVKAGAIVQRPVNPAKLAGMQLTNLPAPCTIAIDGTEHACADTSCELSFTQPATYTVVVSAFPYLDATFSVTQS